VDINISPEYQYAENKPFPVYPTYNRDWTSFYHFLNHIDAPEKFGDNPLKKFYAGQSYLKIKLGKYTAGISTENKWWGPMQRNSLLLSTTGAGFPHVSFANEKPITTKLGAFDFEVLYGNLVNGGWLPPDTSL
jgi:hypothetical protein